MKSAPALIVILLVMLGLLVPPDAEAFTNLPEGFADTLVADDVPAPTAIDWLPPAEGADLLIATQGGTLFRQSGANPAVSVLDLTQTVCAGGEMGLLGLAVDPTFAQGNRFIYLYYTDSRGNGSCDAANRANRVSRLSDGGE
jgi:glucose/arabinose dehydrogenase